jgi:hypothetical protein
MSPRCADTKPTRARDSGQSGVRDDAHARRYSPPGEGVFQRKIAHTKIERLALCTRAY